MNHEVADFWSAQTDGAVRIGVVKTVDAVRTTAGCASSATLWNEVAAKVKFTARSRQAPAGVPAPDAHQLRVRARRGRPGDHLRRPALRPRHHRVGHRARARPQLRPRTLVGPPVRRGRRRRQLPHRPLPRLLRRHGRQLGRARRPERAAGQPAARAAGRAPAVALGLRTGRDGDPGAAVRPDRHPRPPADRLHRRRVLAGVPRRHGCRTPGCPRRATATASTPASSCTAPGRSPTRRCCSTAPRRPRPRWDGDLRSALPVGVPVSLAGGEFTVELQGITAHGAVVRVVPTPPATAATPGARAGR